MNPYKDFSTYLLVAKCQTTGFRLDFKKKILITETAKQRGEISGLVDAYKDYSNNSAWAKRVPAKGQFVLDRLTKQIIKLENDIRCMKTRQSC